MGKSREVRMFTEDEFGRLLSACRHRETRDLMLILHESGCRAREVLNLRAGDVEFQGSWAIIHVDGKTGPRAVPLRETVPILARYARGKPPEGQLFRHSYVTHWMRFRVLTKETGIIKGVRHRVLFHGIRHLAVTLDRGNGMSRAIACKKYGWKPGSPMLDVYEHLTCDDLIRWEMRHGHNAWRFQPMFFWVNYAN